MNDEERRIVDQLREKGYAVSIFTPEELEDVRTDSVEGRMVEAGWDMIEFLKENPNG